MGIECDAHQGIHLFTDHNVAEMATDEVDATPDADSGELIVTTLYQQAYPLLRYALGDRIAVVPGVCPCGLGYPRVDVLGRADDSISILGAKINYDSLLNAVYKDADRRGAMQIVVGGEAPEVRVSLTVVLPESMRHQEKDVRKALMVAQPDLDFLVGSRHLDLSFSYVGEGGFGGRRKVRRVVDVRRPSYAADR